MEIDADVCFSVEPIDQCPFRTYPIHKETRSVKFACFSRDDEESDRLLNQLRSEEIVQVNGPPTGIRNLDIPIKCAPLG